MRLALALVIALGGTAHADLDRRAVRDAIKRHIREIADCWEQHRPPSDHVVVTFTIAASGKVTDASGEQCLVRVVEKIRFPASSSATRVTYPMWIDSAGS